MKLLFLLIIVIFMFSCKSKEQKLKEKIDPILRNIAIQDSFVTKIDSIKIYKIYNLSDLEFAKRKVINLLDKSELYIKLASSFNDDMALQEQSIKLKLSQERLYAYLGSTVLVETEKEEIIRDSEELKKTIAKSQSYSDSSKIFSNQMTVLQVKIDGHKIDSTNFKGYAVLYKILGSDKRNMEVIKDSIKTYLSPNFRIIPINKI